MKKKYLGKDVTFIVWMMRLTLISIVIVGVYLAINTGVFVAVRTNVDYKEIATTTSVNVANMLESLSDEDFSYDEETGILKKGDIEINDKAFWKSLEFNGNVHHTIFWGDTRILTDVQDENGNTVVGTKLTDQSIIDAVNKDGVYSANNVKIYGTPYSVCYYPIRNGNDIVGYVFTGVNQSEANANIFFDVFITTLIMIVLAIIVIFISIRMVRKKALEFSEKFTSVSGVADEKKNKVSELGQETNGNMDQINTAIMQMSQAVTQQASHTEEIMGTMEQFGENLEDIMKQVQDTSIVTNDGTAYMDELKEELLSLEEASKENSSEIVNICNQIEEDNKAVENIGQIVNVINDIAFQITILSFNASVEAARAGDAGRGFAVVAGSIKDLSDKTQQSVNDITEIIGKVNEKMAATGQASQELMEKNDKMVNELATTKEKMNSVTEAFDEISENIGVIQEGSTSILIAKNQVVETVSSLAAASEENAAMSEEIASTSNVVINTTESLMGEIAQLQTIIDTIDEVQKSFV